MKRHSGGSRTRLPGKRLEPSRADYEAAAAAAGRRLQSFLRGADSVAKNEARAQHWRSRSPEERIREHLASMSGFRATPPPFEEEGEE